MNAFIQLKLATLIHLFFTHDVKTGEKQIIWKSNAVPTAAQMPMQKTVYMIMNQDGEKQEEESSHWFSDDQT